MQQSAEKGACGFPREEATRAGELFLVYETMRTSHPARARNQPQLFRGPLGSFTNHTEEDDYFTNVYRQFYLLN